MKDSKRVREIARRLRKLYGQRSRDREDVGDVLIRTVLSQNTSDINSGRAFRRLKDRYPTIEELAKAEVEDIEKAIEPGGLYRRKARIISSLASELKEQEPELESMSNSRAREYLKSLKGVGPKTASCVLLFGLGRDVLPVDTHVYRLSQRIGLIDESVPRKRAGEELEKLVPPEIRYQLHLDLIAHGRKVCRPRNPRCESCVIQDLCDFGSSIGTELGEE